MTLAKEAMKRGLDPKKDFHVKVLMLSGIELCTPELAENLENLWNAKIYNSLYGSQEAFCHCIFNTKWFVTSTFT